jgi:hypothetical protein
MLLLAHARGACEKQGACAAALDGQEVARMTAQELRP